VAQYKFFVIIIIIYIYVYIYTCIYAVYIQRQSVFTRIAGAVSNWTGRASKPQPPQSHPDVITFVDMTLSGVKGSSKKAEQLVSPSSTWGYGGPQGDWSTDESLVTSDATDTSRKRLVTSSQSTHHVDKRSRRRSSSVMMTSSRKVE